MPFSIHFINAKTWSIKVAVSAFASHFVGGAPQDIVGELFFETFAVHLIVFKESSPVVAFENVVGGACRALDRGCVAIDGFYGCVGTAGRNAA